jgi:hypothetical protein
MARSTRSTQQDMLAPHHVHLQKSSLCCSCSMTFRLNLLWSWDPAARWQQLYTSHQLRSGVAKWNNRSSSGCCIVGLLRVLLGATVQQLGLTRLTIANQLRPFFSGRESLWWFRNKGRKPLCLTELEESEVRFSISIHFYYFCRLRR